MCACIKKFSPLCFQPQYSYVDGDGTVPTESAKVLSPIFLYSVEHLPVAILNFFVNCFEQSCNAKPDRYAYGSSPKRRAFVWTMWCSHYILLPNLSSDSNYLSVLICGVLVFSYYRVMDWKPQKGWELLLLIVEYYEMKQYFNLLKNGWMLSQWLVSNLKHLKLQMLIQSCIWLYNLLLSFLIYQMKMPFLASKKKEKKLKRDLKYGS